MTKPQVKTILFSRKGVPVSDFEVTKKVNQIIKSKKLKHSISNKVLFDLFRLKIKYKEINREDYIFQVEDFYGDICQMDISVNGKLSFGIDSLDVHNNILNGLIS